MKYITRCLLLALCGLAPAGTIAQAETVPNIISDIDKNLLIILTVVITALVLLVFVLFNLIKRVRGKKSFYTALLKAQSAVGEGVVVVEGKDIVYINSVMETMLGYGQSDFLSMPSVMHLVSIEDRERLLNVVQLSQEKNDLTSRFEMGLVNNKGYRLDAEIAISGFKYGDKSRTLMICLDVTERKRVLESLRNLNESLETNIQAATDELNTERQLVETMLNNAGALVVVLDNEGRIIRFNGSCEQLTLFSFDELQQKYFWDCMTTADNKSRLKEQIVNLVKKPSNSSFTFEWVIRSREPRLITWYPGVLTDANGAVQNIILTGIDVTEFRLAKAAMVKANTDLKATVHSLQETQEQLLTAEKMATLGSQVESISSEISKPLDAAIKDLRKLREQGQAGPQRQQLDSLLQNLERAAGLASSFHQVAVDQASEEWRHIDLKTYLDDIILSLQAPLIKQSITVRNQVPAGINLYTNPGVIYQVFSNLLMNSLTHGFERGQAGEIRIDGGVSSKRVSLSYADNGKGIPLANHNKIFDAFYTTRDGSGLGLHLARKLLAETLKGRIALQDKAGAGVHFEIEFPLIELPVSLRPAASTPRRRSSPA